MCVVPAAAISALDGCRSQAIMHFLMVWLSTFAYLQLPFSAFGYSEWGRHRQQLDTTSCPRAGEADHMVAAGWPECQSGWRPALSPRPRGGAPCTPEKDVNANHALTLRRARAPSVMAPLDGKRRAMRRWLCRMSAFLTSGMWTGQRFGRLASR